MAGITTSGWGSFATQLGTVVKGLEEAQRSKSDRWVGTADRKAHFSEFGTSKQRAEPWFRPALRQTAAEFNAGKFIRSSAKGALRRGGIAFAVLGSPTKSLIEPMAKRAAQLAAGNAERHGLRRSGALIDSITWAKTVRELAAKSRAAMGSRRL